MTTTSRRPMIALTALLAVPGLLLGLSACSGEASTESASAAPVSFEDWQLKFSDCLREKGVDMPDPKADGSMNINVNEIDMDAYEAAAPQCQEEVGPPPASSEGGTTEEQSMKQTLEAAECLRDHGFDVPDPTRDTGLQVPDDVPDDVSEKCLATFQSTGGGGSAPSISRED
ncbi:hypothetical protein [Plantibacter sp. VKM Ac-2876]|uniref:hypothetical protein n=1 Tax=Plantibacter sp. VKM Ac-2876 TaxID=2783826 RepID=UPI00188A5B7F|nr:hypothetical protein [Plantibacter sp. VKM Ac-2876]MBF4563657.1 hypothetical protein [Plantibacter sp. VKM Ac-2876]